MNKLGMLAVIMIVIFFFWLYLDNLDHKKKEEQDE